MRKRIWDFHIPDPSFVEEWSPLQQMAYLLAGTTLTRFMYYHAWILAEAVCNASGMGFNGYDENGKAKWDLATNVDILSFEVNTNTQFICKDTYVAMKQKAKGCSSTEQFFESKFQFLWHTRSP